MEDLAAGYYSSPLGILKIAYSAKGITSVVFTNTWYEQSPDDLFLQNCFDQLDAYFAGSLQGFDLDLDLQGTPFQLSVWEQLQSIPYGHTVSYLEIANQLGSPKAVRAVGKANAHNPVSIIVPCHRVIGASGNLTGYAGGLWRKKWLLEHELRYKQLSIF